MVPGLKWTEGAQEMVEWLLLRVAGQVRLETRNREVGLSLWNLAVAVGVCLSVVAAEPVDAQGAGAAMPGRLEVALLPRHGSVTRLQDPDMRSVAWLSHLLIGASLGAVTGYAVFEVATDDPCPSGTIGIANCEVSPSRGESMLLGTLAGGVVGVVVGRLLGTRRERGHGWTVVPHVGASSQLGILVRLRK